MRPHLSHTRIANGRYPASGCVNPLVKVVATILRKELWKGAPISCTSCLPNLSISVRSCPPHMGHALPCIAAVERIQNLLMFVFCHGKEFYQAAHVAGRRVPRRLPALLTAILLACALRMKALL